MFPTAKSIWAYSTLSICWSTFKLCPWHAALALICRAYMITDNVNWALATCLASLLWKKKIVIISGDTTKKACPHIELMTQLSWPKLSNCVALLLQLHLAGVFKKLSTDVRAVLHLLMAIHHIHTMDQSIESLCQLCINAWMLWLMVDPACLLVYSYLKESYKSCHWSFGRHNFILAHAIVWWCVYCCITPHDEGWHTYQQFVHLRRHPILFDFFSCSMS